MIERSMSFISDPILKKQKEIELLEDLIINNDEETNEFIQQVFIISS